MTEQLVDEVRRSVADAHGLPEAAVSFLTGETLTEIEASAARLAELLAGRSGPEPEESEPESMADVIAKSIIEKKQRQAALIGALHPDPPQLRDADGKFASKPSGGFDGGARARLAPSPGDPVQDHNEAVVQLAQFSKLGHSGF
jgi:hypothetical protein